MTRFEMENMEKPLKCTRKRSLFWIQLQTISLHTTKTERPLMKNWFVEFKLKIITLVRARISISSASNYFFFLFGLEKNALAKWEMKCFNSLHVELILKWLKLCILFKRFIRYNFTYFCTRVRKFARLAFVEFCSNKAWKSCLIKIKVYSRL